MDVDHSDLDQSQDSDDLNIEEFEDAERNCKLSIYVDRMHEP
jgi:hypothetical protein